MTPKSVLMVALLLAPGPCLAQSPGAPAPMPGMQHGAVPSDEMPSSRAYRDSMMKMHHDMDIRYSGDADRDFVAGMIPHHQGAIDMAKVELRYGHDPALKRLARDIVAAQEKEIAFMRQWQAKHAH